FEERLSGEEITVNGQRLRESRDHLYRTTIQPLEVGSLTLTFEWQDETLERRYYVPYPPQLDFSLADPALLTMLAVDSGGEQLEGSEPLFQGGGRYEFKMPMWPWLLVVCLLTFMYELVKRYDPFLLRRRKGENR